MTEDEHAGEIQCPVCGSPDEILTTCGKCGEKWYTYEQSMTASRLHRKRTGQPLKVLRRKSGGTQPEENP